MAALSPKINTYHCICSYLLFASTHTLSSLPRRAAPSLDSAIILPLPSSAPTFSPLSLPSPADELEEQETEEGQIQSLETPTGKIEDMPPEGYTMLLGMVQDKKPLIVRREDGFERRECWKCGRCGVVVGYCLEGMQGKEGLRMVYLLPAGIMGTEFMVGREGKKRIGEGDVEILGGKAVAGWE